MMTFFSSRSSLFLLAFTALPLLSHDNFEKKDIELISEIEEGYLYCDKNRSKLFDLVDQLCAFETDKNSPAWLLRSYIDAGYSIGTTESVLDVLEYVEQRLDEIYRKIDGQQAEKMYAYLDEVMRDIKDGALKANPADFSDAQKRDCCSDVIIPLGQTIKVREKLYVLRKAKFFQDVEFKSTVEIDGTLFAADEVVGCDLTVGCNINMHNSNNAFVGNITKDGASFINNFGANNTFVGINAGNFTMTGADNTGFGLNTLAGNTGGSGNTAMGSGALPINSSGSANTAVGVSALINNIAGDFNTAIGTATLASNTTGVSNTAVGTGALSGNTTGSINTAIGVNAGILLTSGDNNIYINNTGVAVESATIRVGTLGTQTAAYIQGIFGAVVAGGGLGVEVDSVGKLGTVVSSAAFKTDIQDMGHSSDALMQLRPVTFVYKGDATNTQQYGLIAEEVAQVFPQLVVNDLENKPYSVRYQVLPVLLLNAIQKQQAAIQALADRVDRLEGIEAA